MRAQIEAARQQATSNTWLVLGVVDGGAAVARGVRAAGAAFRLADDALVVRGGSNTAEQLAKGAESIDASGQLHGVSVNSKAGASVAELAEGIPHSKVGVTTVGAIRAIGGRVAADATRTNPNHCLVSCVTPEALSNLLTPVIRNPARP